MPLLDERMREQVRGMLADLTGPVRLVFFERALDCGTCLEARRLLEEVATLSEKVSLETYNVVTDREKAREFRVDDAPVVAVVGEKDHGIRYYGAPAGYEFGALVETIRDVSAGQAALDPSTVAALTGLTSPVHVRIFVTPT